MKKPQPKKAIPHHEEILQRVPQVKVDALTYMQVTDYATVSASARIFLQHLQPRATRKARKKAAA